MGVRHVPRTARLTGCAGQKTGQQDKWSQHLAKQGRDFFFFLDWEKKMLCIGAVGNALRMSGLGRGPVFLF